MMEGTYEFAGHAISIRSNYEWLHRKCREYRSEKEPEVFFDITPEDIQWEREYFLRQCASEKLPAHAFSEPYLEDIAAYRKIAAWLIEDSTILFHASAIAVDGRGYMFTAKSGTGKSTHARLWREMLGDRSVMINDDKPLVHVEGSSVIVYGTPWDGKHGLSSNRSVSVAAISILKQSEENRIRLISPRDAWPVMIQQAYRPEDPERVKKTMDILQRIIENVPIYELHCNMQPEAARVSFGTMVQGKEENE